MLIFHQSSPFVTNVTWRYIYHVAIESGTWLQNWRLCERKVPYPTGCFTMTDFPTCCQHSLLFRICNSNLIVGYPRLMVRLWVSDDALTWGLMQKSYFHFMIPIRPTTFNYFTLWHPDIIYIYNLLLLFIWIKQCCGSAVCGNHCVGVLHTITPK
jgi:hypothetical protein